MPGLLVLAWCGLSHNHKRRFNVENMAIKSTNYALTMLYYNSNEYGREMLMGNVHIKEEAVSITEDRNAKMVLNIFSSYLYISHSHFSLMFVTIVIMVIKHGYRTVTLYCLKSTIFV